MALCKTDAIILHSRKQGETSKIVSMYTKKYGKLSLMAQGSRNIRSKHLGTLESFSHVSILFYYKQQRGLQYLSQVSLCSPFPSLSNELGKMTLASIACEIIEKSENEGHTNPDLYELLLNALMALDRCRKGSKQIIRAFKLKFLSLSGFEADFDSCMHCGKSEPDAMNQVSIANARYCCANCPPPDAPLSALNRHGVKLLRWFPGVSMHQVADATCSRQTANQVDHVLQNILCYHIDALCRLKSEIYLKQIENGLRCKQKTNQS